MKLIVVHYFMSFGEFCDINNIKCESFECKQFKLAAEIRNKT